MTETHSPTRRFWLGGKRAAEQDRFFRDALEPLGWQLGDEHDWDAGWITGMPDPRQFRRVSPARKMNHFPGNAALTVKSRLHDSLATLRDRIRERHGANHELARRLAFFPRAYVLPGDYHALQEAALADPDQRWILKPTNASKGKGVRVLQDVAEAPLQQDWLVQEYLANPHTIRGHKYVLRLYVLITSLTPLRVYLYRQGFAKLASAPWDPDDADNPYSQLTNPDINVLNHDAEVPVEFIDLDRYRQWLRDQGHDDAALFAQIEDLVALTVIAAVDAMRRRTAQAGADPRGCYELLGLDCLVDDTLKPWILECNLSPSLGTCAAPESGGRIEEAVKSELVRDMVTLVDLPGRAQPQAEPDPDDATALAAEAAAENARAGGFERLLPSSRPEHYLPYFTLPTLADVRLAEGVTARALPACIVQRRHVAELLDDQRLALYDTRSGRLYQPNDTATLIWLLATEGYAPDAIADQLAHASATTGAAPAHAALRREVWETLHEWCCSGLLCQQGSASVASPAPLETRDPVASVSLRRQIMTLRLGGREWRLDVADDPAMARLTSWFGARLSPRMEAGEGALPRLTVLRESGGYALASDQQLLAARLGLAQLGPVLSAHLLRQAARPGCPVVDVPVLVSAHGTAVLWLLPDDAPHRALLQGLQAAAGGELTRGLRPVLGEPGIAETLGFPVANGLPERLTPLAERISLRGVLLPADEPLAPMGMLDALSALLPVCLHADGQALDAQQVTAFAEWLVALGVVGVGEEGHTPDVASLVDWLNRVTAPAASPATAKG